jgi:hypothetical protein
MRDLSYYTYGGLSIQKTGDGEVKRRCFPAFTRLAAAMHEGRACQMSVAFWRRR